MRQTTSSFQRLRVGVLLDGPRASRHLRDLLTFLEFEPSLRLVGVWFPAGQAQPAGAGLAARCRRAVWRLDARLARLGAAQDAGLGVQKVDASPWPPGVAGRHAHDHLEANNGHGHGHGHSHSHSHGHAGPAAPAGAAGHDHTRGHDHGPGPAPAGAVERHADDDRHGEVPGPGQPQHAIAVDLLVCAGALSDERLQPMLAGVRYGAISLDFSLSAPPDEARLGLAECLAGAHQAGIVLRATSAGELKPWVIREGWFQTHWSVGRTRAVLMAAGLRMLKDAIVQCQRWHEAAGDGESLLAGGALCRAVWPEGPQAMHHWGRAQPLPPGPSSGRLGPASFPELLAYGRRTFGRLWRKALDARRGRSYLWQLGFMPAGDPAAPEVAQVRPAGAPGRRFQADPFLVLPDEPDGKPLVFIEEWSPRRRRGHISVLEVDAGRDGVLAPGQTVQLRHLGKVIQTGHHLSFPFHFRWQGEHYLCPEASASGRITVWRARRFPMDWEPAATLMRDVSAVDTMLFEAHGRWWMLTNLDRTAGTLVAATRDFHSELHLFHADDPLSSDWTPHPMNPLRIDSYGGRNAGLLVSDAGIFRYGQMQAFDCYGHGVAIYRITELSTTRYREELVRVISPGMLKGVGGLHGLHTFGQAGGLAVVDLLHRGGLRDIDKKRGGASGRGPVQGE